MFIADQAPIWWGGCRDVGSKWWTGPFSTFQENGRAGGAPHLSPFLQRKEVGSPGYALPTEWDDSTLVVFSHCIFFF